jgi:tetratricopeptide (TPR) repeat protein
MKYRILQDALKEVEEGIQHTGRSGFGIMLISAYSFESRLRLLLGDVDRAENSLGHAQKLASKLSTVAQQDGEIFLSRLLLDLHHMEQAIALGNKKASTMHYANALKTGVGALKAAHKYAFFKTESLKLIGVCYWLIGKQRKAMKWWHKSIKEGQSLNDRLELSRTYFEVGKRLLEPQSKYKELDGIKAQDYLEKARVMFEEMNLQWDLDELEKLKIQIAT